MIKQLYLFLFSCITLPAFSQDDSTKIPFVAYWSIGDSYDFKILKSQKTWSENEITKDDQHEYIANFTVIDSTKDSYTIVWKYDLDPNEFLEIPNEYKESFSKFNQIAVKYKTTETGVFVEILNWQEVSEVMNDLIDQIVLEVAGKDAEKRDELNSYFGPLKQLFLSKQGVEELVYKDIQLFHLAIGQEFDTKEPLIVEGFMPNMFGGDPIKATTKIEVEDVLLKEKFCSIKQETRIDSEGTKAMVLDLLKRMNLDVEEMEIIIETAVLEFVDSTEFNFFYDPCIPLLIETRREMIMNINGEDLKFLDKTVIELVEK